MKNKKLIFKLIGKYKQSCDDIPRIKLIHRYLLAVDALGGSVEFARLHIHSLLERAEFMTSDDILRENVFITQLLEQSMYSAMESMREKNIARYCETKSQKQAKRLKAFDGNIPF